MRLKLKENPKEWRKFALVWTIAPALVCAWLYHKGKLASLTIPLSVLVPFFLIGMIFPRSMRPLYRGVMKATFPIGLFLGKIMLTLFFLLMVTPLGLLLRAFGKDLLQIKKVQRETYWETPPAESAHDRMF